MTGKEILNIFKECGAIQEGHFLLSSGLHSEKYLQAALVLQFPQVAQTLSEELVRKLGKEKIDVVISPAIGGIVLSYQVAKILRARSIFAERENDKMKLRRGFNIKPGEKILITEDILTTGASVKELIDLINNYKGQLKAVAILIDRSKNEVFKGLKLASLLKLDIKTYRQQECPLCRKGLPLIKPGSRKI
jgi:orotate phosphoribosyltransferase